MELTYAALLVHILDDFRQEGGFVAVDILRRRSVLGHFVVDDSTRRFGAV